jgi:hypothetical protein
MQMMSTAQQLSPILPPNTSGLRRTYGSFDGEYANAGPGPVKGESPSPPSTASTPSGIFPTSSYHSKIPVPSPLSSHTSVPSASASETPITPPPPLGESYERDSRDSKDSRDSSITGKDYEYTSSPVGGPGYEYYRGRESALGSPGRAAPEREYAVSVRVGDGRKTIVS